MVQGGPLPTTKDTLLMLCCPCCLHPPCHPAICFDLAHQRAKTARLQSAALPSTLPCKPSTPPPHSTIGCHPEATQPPHHQQKALLQPGPAAATAAALYLAMQQQYPSSLRFRCTFCFLSLVMSKLRIVRTLPLLKHLRRVWWLLGAPLGLAAATTIWPRGLCMAAGL
jgi:hypothetical protein